MTSSEERSAVAERMRTYTHGFDFGDSQPFFYIAKAVFADADRHTYEDVFNRLADLLDATCEIESVDSTAGLPAYNLSCGDTVFVHLNEPMPSYCPYCGARLLLEHEFFPHELFPRFMAKEVHE